VCTSFREGQDHHNDIGRTVRVASDRASVWGNLDPSSVLCLGSRETVLSESRKVLEAVMPLTWRFVLCPGCLVNSNCPPDNVRAMSEAAEMFGLYSAPPRGLERTPIV
jgi:uroporphyrinogen decarboxylase